MSIFNKQHFSLQVLRQDSVLRTLSGKEISAMKVFSYSLSYFKDLAIQEINDQSGLRITCDVIRWVITVPAIWKASAKQFMRQAAYQVCKVTLQVEVCLNLNRSFARFSVWNLY